MDLDGRVMVNMIDDDEAERARLIRVRNIDDHHLSEARRQASGPHNSKLVVLIGSSGSSKSLTALLLFGHGPETDCLRRKLSRRS